MSREDKLFQDALKEIKEDSYPSDEQKAKMLSCIIQECKEEDESMIVKIKRIVCVYPWRCAVAISALQTLVFTMIFGTKYTDLLLSVFRNQ